MTRFLYDVSFFIFSLFYLPFFFLKGKFKRDSLSRFGIIPEETQRCLTGSPVLWVHAVSVGEIGLAVGFLSRLGEHFKDTRFLITTTTTAGYEVAKKIKNEEDVLLYFPVDFRFAVKAFVRQVAPTAVVLFETEIWPNLIMELFDRKIPVVILNGRISESAFARYHRVRFFLKKILDHVSAIGAQDERMRGRFLSLGAGADRVCVTGNLKFDWTPSQALDEATQRLRLFCRRPSEFLLVAGSTHPGEEEILLEVHREIRTRFPNFRLLIAPRHLHRVPDIERTASKRGVALRKLSLDDIPGCASDDAGEVWLLNQMGVLSSFYAVADAAFVGGSLVPVGGHNLVEPAYYEKPILFGPFMDNFHEMAEEFKKNGAAIEVRDSRELARQLERMVQDASHGRRLGQAAKRLVSRHQGATEKNKELFIKYWQSRKERKLVSA